MTARRPGGAVLVGAWRGRWSKCKMLAACRAGFRTPKIPGRLLVLAIAASPILLGASARVAAANDQGGQLAAVCASCHRLDGGEKGIPSIIGLGEDRLTRAMLEYRLGERSSHIMRAIALSLSDEEIAAVARFLAAQGRKAGPP
jgi:cytochrome subunit of sulfide dehydrogenase